MNSKWLISIAYLIINLVINIAQADIQKIIPSKTSFQVSSGDIVEFDLDYSSSSPAQTTGLGLKLNYDSSKLLLINISEVFSTGKLAQSIGTKKNGNGELEGSDLTGQVINIAWVSLNGKWPGADTAGVKLMRVKFKVVEELDSSTTINISGEASADNIFSTTPVVISPIKKSTAFKLPPATGGGVISWWFILSFLLLVVFQQCKRYVKVNQKMH